MNKKIVIGISGGVDSSVCAALLKQQGYDIIGAVIKVWHENENAFDTGDAFADIYRDALAVCEHIGIPLHIIDCAEDFRRKIVDYFADAYMHGRTPNPCARCNPQIKFKALAAFADSVGAEHIATGHYAHIEQDAQSGRWIIRRSAADKKDQTYFLYALPQSILSRIIMPLSNMDKPQVRSIAAELGIPVAQKPDSQEICFLENDYVDFIAQYTGKSPIPGHFIDTDGNILGTHLGIIHYTIGQRKGLGISFGKPMFVTAINPVANTVTLGEAGSEFTDRLTVRNVNYIACADITEPIRAQVKTRHGAKPAPATITPLPNSDLSVVFDAPIRAVTPGQAAVFYNDEVMLGGGEIL